MAAAGVTHALCIVREPCRLAGGACARDGARQFLCDRRRASRLRGHARTVGRRSRLARAAGEGRRDRRNRARLLPAARRSRMAARALSHAHPGGAVTRGKPLVVHTRSAAADTLSIMRDEGAGEAGGVMHCFTETWEVARAALDLGLPHLVLGHRHVQECAGAQGRRPARAARSDADRDRLALPRAGAVSRQAQPAGLRRARRDEIARLRGESRGDNRRGDEREFLSAVRHRSAMEVADS